MDSEPTNYASNLHIKQLFSPKTPEFPHIDCLQFANTGGICKKCISFSHNMCL